MPRCPANPESGTAKLNRARVLRDTGPGCAAPRSPLLARRERCSRSRRACRRREDDHGDPVVENPSSCRTAPAATRARRDLHAVRCRLQPRSAQELQRVDTAPLRQRVVRPRAGSAPRFPQAGRPEPPTRPFTRPAQPATRVSPRSPGATRLARDAQPGRPPAARSAASSAADLERI